MIKGYEVITLCGSTKFKDDFLRVQKELTLKGFIVISVGLFGHADGDYQTVLTEEIKVMLDDMHKRKIDLANTIYVINKNGYIGSSTRSEIDYAIATGKNVVYMESPEIETLTPCFAEIGQDGDWYMIGEKCNTYEEAYAIIDGFKKQNPSWSEYGTQFRVSNENTLQR